MIIGPCMRKILIVDDEPDIRRTIAGIFSDVYEILEASTVEEALDVMAAQAPRLVLLDFSLPGMNGIDFLKKARQLDCRAAVIMLTAEQDLDLARQALELGAVEFVTKPFETTYLRSEVSRIVDGPAREDASGDSRPWRTV